MGRRSLRRPGKGSLGPGRPCRHCWANTTRPVMWEMERYIGARFMESPCEAPTEWCVEGSWAGLPLNIPSPPPQECSGISSSSALGILGGAIRCLWWLLRGLPKKGAVWSSQSVLALKPSSAFFEQSLTLRKSLNLSEPHLLPYKMRQ